jgi:16S rRNA (adenine1518-N6/adenine1519-N6)-dimethyltransferase
MRDEIHKMSPDTFSGDLTERGTLNRLLLKHGLRPNKGLGQHLLVSRRALEAVVATADLTPEDAVLEVGAGTGVLTRELAARARRVIPHDPNLSPLRGIHQLRRRASRIEAGRDEDVCIQDHRL